MKLDVLVAEIGSTTTVVNGFILGSDARFVGSGQAPTTVEDGDVNIGLKNAMDDLRCHLNTEQLTYDELMATSSAAGGLKMTVHGLVYDMTVKAAKEAALGAGANIHMVTAGRLRRTDLKKIKDIEPNIMLLAGGVDYGERDTAIYNAEMIAQLNLGIPIIYAGNIENQDEIQLIFEESNSQLYIVDNVYPRIDQLNIEPTRQVIQDVFEEYIIHAPGMEHVRDTVSGSIIPTPAGVMEATKMLADMLGDVVTIDIGGATTDIHSVTDGSEEIARIMIAPEPRAKRTVEGDLGVYINASNIIDLVSKDVLMEKLRLTENELNERIQDHPPIPETDQEIRFVEALAEVACTHALDRHAGKLIDLYSTAGRKKMAQGKDLSAVQYVVGTGGALTRLPARLDIIRAGLDDWSKMKLLPASDVRILIDNDYIMASIGVLSKTHLLAAQQFMRRSLGMEE